MKTIIQKFQIVMAMLCLSISASAYDFEVDGLYYNILSTVDRTVVLTYKEPVIVNGHYLGGYNDYSKETLSIPSKVDYLGQSLNVIGVDIQAFDDNTAIKKLIIPSSIQWLHQECFRGCTALEEVIIEDSDSPLSFQMNGRSFYFSGCPISTLYLGRNISLPFNIALPPFARLEELSNISLSDNVTVLPEEMFMGCTSLKTITLPEACTEIGAQAFAGCTNLISIENTSQILEIGESTFLNCSNLKSFQGDNLISMGSGSFQNCSSLSNIELGNSIPIIPKSAFDGCVLLSSIIIPEETTEISSYAFQGCRKLEKIVLPSKLNGVSNYAFNGCESLKSIVIDYNEEPLMLGGLFLWEPENGKIGVIEHLEINRNIKWSGTGCFDFTDLKDISIGPHVTYINSVFQVNLASGLERITIYAKNPPKTNWKFYNNLLTTVKIIVPTGTKEAYQNSDVWKEFWSIEESDLNSATDELFFENNSVSVTANDGKIHILNKDEKTNVRVYSISGNLLAETTKDIIPNITRGVYIVNVGTKKYKVKI